MDPVVTSVPSMGQIKEALMYCGHMCGMWQKILFISKATIKIQKVYSLTHIYCCHKVFVVYIIPHRSKCFSNKLQQFTSTYV